MKLRKCKKLLAVTSMVALVGSVTVFADTYINNPFDNNNAAYGRYMLDVNSSSGMRSCEARAWGSSDYKYKIELTTVLYDGQEVINDTGYNYGNAYVSRSYEWAEDYQARMIVREGINNKYNIVVSGS